MPAHSTPGRGAVLASATMHGVLLLGAWWMSSNVEPPIHYEVIQIELFSEPPASSTEEAQPDPEVAPPEDLVVETPDPEPPAPDPEPQPVVRPDPEPEPAPPTRTEPETPPPATPPEERTSSSTPEPAPESTTSGEDINVRMEGLRRDYPAYYQNIIVQIRRCFRPTSTGRTTMQFEIARDGSVSRIEVVEPSGSIIFDIEAESAVECAGQGRRFGALPEDLGLDRLHVQFVINRDG